MKKSLIALLFLTVVTNFESHGSWKTRTSMGTNLGSIAGIPVNFRVSYEDEVSGYTILGVCAACLAIKIGYDWSWHGDYTRQSENAFRRFLNYVHINNISSLKDPSLYNFFKTIDPDFCLTYEAWLRNSYDSWLKPWNWTASQKEAYEKMEILSMIALHGPMISLDEATVDAELANHARKYCTAVCEYPVVYYGNQIDSHLAAIKKGFSVKSPDVQRMLIELEQELYKLKYVLRGNKAYIDECHTLKTHQLLQQAAQNR